MAPNNELTAIIPNLPSVPVQPLLESSAKEFGMYPHWKRFPWVLEIHRYRDLNDLLESLDEKVIAPAEAKAKELRAVTTIEAITRKANDPTDTTP